jgi:hypothetical protein
LIKYKDNNILNLVEVKSTYRSTAIATKSKISVATEYVEKNGLRFELWLDDKIKSFGINYLDEKWSDLIIYKQKTQDKS